MPAQKSRHDLEQIPHSTKNGYVLSPGSTVASFQLAGDIEPHTSADTPVLPIRLIPIEAVCEMLGLKRSCVYAMVADGILPRPIKFGTSRRASSRWLESEIFHFIMKKAGERQSSSASSEK